MDSGLRLYRTSRCVRALCLLRCSAVHQATLPGGRDAHPSEAPSKHSKPAPHPSPRAPNAPTAPCPHLFLASSSSASATTRSAAQNF